MTQPKTVFSFFTTIFLALLLTTSSAFAKTNDVNTAEKRVIAVTSRVVNLITANSALYERDQNALYQLVRREVLPFIDFNAMSKLTLGKHWRSASKSQRQRFINAFREMLVRSYASTMLDYTNSNIRAGNSTPQKKPGFVLVRTIVTPQGDSAIAANYSLRKVGNDWKAYNIEIAGINLVTNFRTNFTREVSAKGLNALITRIEKSGK